MSFSFGGFGAASTPGTAFGAASAPAFGAASTPGFGAASTPAFGAASTPGFASFGSVPAFGANPSPAPFSGFGFNAASAASSSPFSFSTNTTSTAVTTSAPAFGASASLFGATTTPSMFNATTGSMFGTAPAATAATNALQQQQQNQSNLITYNTRYDDLPAERQRDLQDIQREISNYREDCEKLERDQRLHGSLSLKKSLEEETGSLKQSLQGLLNSIRADDEALADFREKVLKLLRSTENAVRTFQRAKLWRDAPQMYKGQIIPPQVQELLASPVLLPSPYLEQAIQGFQQTLDNYRQVIGELEQALPSDIMASLGASDESSLVERLPLVISHMHDYFVHVAARMERLHQEVQRSKDAFITQQREQGNYSDPFEESKRHLAMMSPRPDGRGSLTDHNSPRQHYSLVPSTPMTGGVPLFQESPLGATVPTPFGTPFGGPISPAAGDMSRKGQASSGRRRR